MLLCYRYVILPLISYSYDSDCRLRFSICLVLTLLASPCFMNCLQSFKLAIEIDCLVIVILLSGLWYWLWLVFSDCLNVGVVLLQIYSVWQDSVVCHASHILKLLQGNANSTIQLLCLPQKRSKRGRHWSRLWGNMVVIATNII